MENFNTILNRYKILGTIGSGGFGTVKIAWDTRIQRKVAIKIIQLNEGEIQRASLLDVAQSGNANDFKSISKTAGHDVDSQVTMKADSGSDIPVQNNEKKDEDPYRERWHGLVPWKEYLKEDDEKKRNETLPATILTQENISQQNADYVDAAKEETLEGQQTEIINNEEQDGSKELDSQRSSQEQTSESDEVFDQEFKTSLIDLPGLDEARAAAKLTSPHIVGVYDFEVSGYCAYLIMEYIEGITLTQLLKELKNDISIDEISAIFEAVSKALSTAHKKRVLHLDVKPDNILISVDGEVKVTDFGLAKLADYSSDITAGGGTIGYMPLEQMRKETLDAKADQWAIASVLYEMLTGSNPFLGRSLEEAEQKIVDANLLLPSIFWEGVDEAFDDVIFKALSIKKEGRYKTVSAFYKDAHRFLGNPKRGRAELKNAIAWCMETPAPQEPKSSRVKSKQKSSLFQAIVSSYSKNNKKDDYNSHENVPVEDTFDSLDDDQFDYRSSEEEAEAYYRELVHEKTSRIKDTWDTCLPSLKKVVGGALSAFIAWLSLTNITLIGSLFPQASLFFLLPIVAIVGIAGAFASHLGALFSFSLLGMAVALQGSPQIGIPFIALTLTWWYFIGRNYEESSLTILCMPLLITGGSSSYAPFICGLFLKPIVSFVSILYMSIVALLLASAGDALLVGWNFFSSFSFTQGDIFSLFLHRATQMSTWATIAGWIIAAIVLSTSRLSKSRIFRFFGVAIAVAAVFTGTLIFGEITPQLLFSGIVSSVILVIDFARFCNPYHAESTD